MKIRKGSKVTVKEKVETYESRECKAYKGTYLTPGEIATVENPNVPYIYSRGHFVFVRFKKDGIPLRTGIDPKNIVEVK